MQLLFYLLFCQFEFYYISYFVVVCYSVSGVTSGVLWSSIEHTLIALMFSTHFCICVYIQYPTQQNEKPSIQFLQFYDKLIGTCSTLHTHYAHNLYNTHLFVEKIDLNFSFKCDFRCCCCCFLSFVYFKMHSTAQTYDLLMCIKL